MVLVFIIVEAIFVFVDTTCTTSLCIHISSRDLPLEFGVLVLLKGGKQTWSITNNKRGVLMTPDPVCGLGTRRWAILKR